VDRTRREKIFQTEVGRNELTMGRTIRSGQEGMFLLHQEHLPAGAALAAVSGVEPGAYTALHPADLQPLEELPRIQLVAQAMGG
jgi:hypothetical protein